MKSRFVGRVGVVLVLAAMPLAWAADLYPSAPPDDPASAMYSGRDILSRLQSGTNAPLRSGAFAEPADGPTAGTMPTLTEIMAAAPATNAAAATPSDVVAGKAYWGLAASNWGTQTGAMPTRALSSATGVVQAGYYEATTLSAVDTNLAPENIRNRVVIFGTTGTYEGTGGMMKTGQTTSRRRGDDGWWRTNNVGNEWPNPRFTVQADTNVVVDNLTGLMWVRAPHSLPGHSTSTNWIEVMDFCNNLTFAGHSDWRLPNILEFRSLIDFGRWNPALPSGHPFTDVQTLFGYWTSTPMAADMTTRWYVFIQSGRMINVSFSTTPGYAWPVRGGN